MPPSSAAAYQSLQNFGNTMLKPQDAIQQGQQQYGVSGIQSQLDALRSLTGNLQTSIAGVDPSVTGRTQGGLVTEAQRAAIVNKERAPLMTQFADTTNKLSDAGHQFDTASGLASQYAQSLLGNQEQQYQHLFGQYTGALDSEKAAEAKRQFDAQMAEARAARAAASAASSYSPDLGGSVGTGAPGAGGQPIDPLAAAVDFANQQKAIAQGGSQVPTFFRESVLKALQQKFAGHLSPQQISDIVYKQVFPDNWASSPRPAAKGGGGGF